MYIFKLIFLHQTWCQAKGSPYDLRRFLFCHMVTPGRSSCNSLTEVLHKERPPCNTKARLVGGEGDLYAVEQGDQLSLEYLTKEGHKVDKKLIDEIMIEIGLEHIEYDEQEE